MRILWVFCIYNEIELLPYKLDHIWRNGIEPYVFDNMSVDGSWEWLQGKGISSERFESAGMFDLKINLDLMHRKIHEVKPDWVINAGADIFYVHLSSSLRGIIEAADAGGFNCIEDCHRSFDFRYTGDEEPGRDPRLTHMHYAEKPLGTILIAKYSLGLKFRSADYFLVPGMRPYRSKSFIMLHYRMRHDAEARKTEQYMRRKKAWDAGRTARCYGAHYERIVNGRQFISEKKDLRDIRESPFWDAVRESAKA